MLTDNQTFRIWSTGWVQKKCGKVADFRTLNQGLVLRVHQQCSELWNNLKKHPNGSVQLSRSVMSNSLQSHELQHARPPCSSPTPGVYPNSCPLSQWSNHPAISSSVVPLLLLPSIFPSIRVFPNESALCIRWPQYWSFRFNISPSNEHPGLTSFRMDWLDLLAVQGTLESLHQHHSSKASILRCSAFFTVQLSHPYMTTGKTIALTRRTSIDTLFPPLLPFRYQTSVDNKDMLHWSSSQAQPSKLFKSQISGKQWPSHM